MVIAFIAYYNNQKPVLWAKEHTVILLDTPPKDAKATLSQLLLGKNGKTDSESFGKILKELSLSLGGGKALSKEEIALLLAKEGETQESKIAPGLLLKLQSEEEGVTETGQPSKPAQSLLSLLHGSEVVQLSDEELETFGMLHPKVAELPVQEIKQLISDAKSYLKLQLGELVDEKEIPHTLKGLVQLAEKKGIDISKITLEQVQPKPSAETSVKTAESLKQSTPKTTPLFAENATQQRGLSNFTTAEIVQTKQAKATEKPQSPKEPQPLNTLLQKEESPAARKTVPSQESDPVDVPDQPLMKAEQAKKATPQSSLKEGNRAEQANAKEANRSEQATVKSEKAAEPPKGQPDNRAEQAAVKSAMQTEQPKTDLKQESVSQAKPEQSVIQAQAKPGNAQQHGSRQGDQTALFNTATTMTDEAPKGMKPEFNTALSQLLHGNESTQSEGGEAEKRVTDIAGHKSADTAAVQLNKEALELKMNEARQMVRHFAGEIREAIQNYKPPFTRLKIQLNPAKFGEVDVTMVQRGNNVHINISSNSAAINTLAQNASELRTQLSQNGLNNATMNFSSSSNPEQQQNQQRQHLAELYEQFEESDHFDLMESLELIIPRYV